MAIVSGEPKLRTGSGRIDRGLQPGDLAPAAPSGGYAGRAYVLHRRAIPRGHRGLHPGGQLDPQLSTAYAARAFVRMSRGDLDRAIEDFTKALAINREDGMAYHGRGVARATGDLPGAVADYTEAIRIDPTSSRRRGTTAASCAPGSTISTAPSRTSPRRCNSTTATRRPIPIAGATYEKRGDWAPGHGRLPDGARSGVAHLESALAGPDAAGPCAGRGKGPLGQCGPRASPNPSEWPPLRPRFKGWDLRGKEAAARLVYGIFLLLLTVGLLADIGKNDVKRLLQAGIGEQTIVEFIRKNAPADPLTVDDITEPRNAGATDAVINAMLGVSRASDALDAGRPTVSRTTRTPTTRRWWRGMAMRRRPILTPIVLSLLLLSILSYYRPYRYYPYNLQLLLSEVSVLLL